MILIPTFHIDNLVAFIVLVDDSVLDELWPPIQKEEKEEARILESEMSAAIQRLKSRKLHAWNIIDGDLMRRGGHDK